MARLTLKFEEAVLKEVTLAQGVVNIGRLPDNLIQVDNLAVSGHHAKIYWENDHYVIEDNNSLNGTYVNSKRITKQPLNDGDNIMIGKHTLSFKDEWHEGPVQQPTAEIAAIPVPTVQATMVLDTKKAREMMAAAVAAKSGAPPAAPAGGAPGATAAAPEPPPPPPKERLGVLSVVSGKTDQSQYVLTGKLTVIGKSDMASIKLKGWFAPKVAAAINRRDNKYFIAASEKSQKVKVNGERIEGQKELSEGDVVEVAGIKVSFSYSD